MKMLLRRRPPIEWIYTDAGRPADVARLKKPGDCVIRAIVEATGKTYAEVREGLDAKTAMWWYEGYGMPLPVRASSVFGCNPMVYREYLTHDLGWMWTPTMGIGTGCRVHLRRDELPRGPIITRLSKHVCAVVDGVVHDTYDPSRDGTRCVYGIFSAGPIVLSKGL